MPASTTPYRWLLRLALRAQPVEVRRRFADEIEGIWADDVRAARRRGRRAQARAAIGALVDVVRSGLRERLQGNGATPGRYRRRIEPHLAPPRKSLLMDMLAQDLRFAVRGLLGRPAFTAVAVLTLALGTGATTAIFSVVHGVLLRPLPYDGAERIVRIWQDDRRDPGQGPADGSVSPVIFRDWSGQASSFEALGAWTRGRQTLTGLGDAELVPGASVSPGFFAVLGAEPVVGRSFTAEEDLPEGPRAVVVSRSFWQQHLGGADDVLGRTLELNGRPHPIVGVAPAGFDFPAGTEVWVPIRNDDEGCGRGCVYLNAVGRLRPGVTVEEARQQMAGISDRLSAEYPGSETNNVAALATLQETTVGDVRQALWLLLGAVAMVLLIACTNVANLLVARGTARADEVAVRAALGAGKGRIVAQLLTESLVLAAAGGALGVVLAAVGVRGLKALSAGDIPRLDEVGLDATVLLFAAGLAVLTALLFGLAPAAQLARRSVAATLRNDARTSSARRGAGRSLLLAAEVAVSLVLLVGAGLLLRSFSALQGVDTGYTVDGVATFSVSLPGARYPGPQEGLAFLDRLEERLDALPGVQEAGRIVGPPLGNIEISSSFVRTDLPDPEPGQGPAAALLIVDEDFFSILDVPLVAGRPFAATDGHDALPVALVNQRLVDRFFPDGEALGKQISVGVSLGWPEPGPRTIVGVVGNLRTGSLTDEPVPEIYVPHAQSGAGFATFLMRTATPAEALQAARHEVRALDPDLPVRDPETLRDIFDRRTAQPRFYLFLLALFAVLAVALAGVGLYGVVSYLVAQRRREIGVRMALGAGSGRVTCLVLRQGLGPAVAGAAVGLAGAVAGGRLLEGLLYEVAPVDPLTLAATTLLLLAVVVAACLVPAARAVRIPPASALRAGG